MEIPSPITISLRDDDASNQVALLTNGPGVYALRDKGKFVHLAWSSRLGARVIRLLARAAAGGSTLGAHMKDAGFVLHCWSTGSRLESSLLMYRVLRSERPDDYRKRLRLRLPWFVTLTRRDRFPRLSVVNRFPSELQPVFGPFLFRDAAQRYADNVVACFGLRKCAETFVPDPAHPGCIYGEIKQCLRPCQDAVSTAVYQAEVERVYRFLSTNGESQVRALTQARDGAANALQFEEAADLHKTITRVKEIVREKDDLVCDARSLSGIALTLGAEQRSFRLWPMVDGLWREPLHVQAEEHDTVELLVDRLQDLATLLRANAHASNADNEEHLAILARWYHSSSRDGRWYPLRPGGKPDARRISKAALQMLKNASGFSGS